MNRIDARFAELKAQGRAALIPYLTAGDPDPAVTVELMHTLVAAGADILELGVPFSDPMADGPTIQLACERALAAGTTLRIALRLAAEFRKTDQSTPVVLMGYLNPVEAMGAQAFAQAARAAGVDGVLTVDLAVEEADSLAPMLLAEELAPIFLLAPTTSDERVAQMDAAGRGYLYYVSLKGVTGSAALDTVAVAERLRSLRQVTRLPLAVGFGIREPADAKAIAAVADGVIVGSALVELIARYADDKADLLSRLSEKTRSLADAMR